MNTNELDPTYAGEGIYRENILDHFKSPRNFGTLENPDLKHRELNPVCGDQIEIQANVKEGKIEKIKFNGKGCAISQSSASMLTEKAKSMSLEKAKKITKEEIVEMLGIPISPTRLKCAILSLDTLKNAIMIYEKYGRGD